jgi:hypothetical protein
MPKIFIGSIYGNTIYNNDINLELNKLQDKTIL